MSADRRNESFETSMASIIEFLVFVQSECHNEI